MFQDSKNASMDFLHRSIFIYLFLKSKSCGHPHWSSFQFLMKIHPVEFVLKYKYLLDEYRIHNDK